MPRMRIRSEGVGINFAPTSGLITVPHSTSVALPPGGAMTVSAWVRCNRFTISQFTIMSKGNNYVFDINSAGLRLFGFVSGAAVGVVGPTPKKIADSTWHFCVGTYDGSALRTYLDGVLVDTASYVGNNFDQNTSALLIRNRATFPTDYSGQLAHPQLYNRALTSTEVRSLYFDGRQPTDAATSLKLSYTFDSVQGNNIVDESAAGNNGTLTNGTYITDAPLAIRSAASGRIVPRNFSSTLSLPGSSSGITATTITGLNSASTFSAWFNTSTVAATGRTIIENSTSANTRLTLMMDAGIVRAGYYNGAAYTSKASEKLQPGTWYHAVFAWNGAVATLYINNISQSATSPAPSASAGGALGIGRRGDAATQAFLGHLAEACIWNRTLSAAEISALYYAGTIPSSGLVCKYLLNEGSGTTAIDTSGSGNNGTIVGGTYTSYAPLKTRSAASARTLIT